MFLQNNHNNICHKKAKLLYTECSLWEGHKVNSILTDVSVIDKYLLNCLRNPSA